MWNRSCLTLKIHGKWSTRIDIEIYQWITNYKMWINFEKTVQSKIQLNIKHNIDPDDDGFECDFNFAFYVDVLYKPFLCTSKSMLLLV